MYIPKHVLVSKDKCMSFLTTQMTRSIKSVFAGEYIFNSIHKKVSNLASNFNFTFTKFIYNFNFASGF